VSLNNKRRIFRSGTGSIRARTPKLLPSPGVWLAAAGGASTLLAAAWLFVRSSDAPALAPPSRHITAAAGTLAVLGGDTLRVGDQVVRLDGIDAPLRGSVCHSGGREVDCSVTAANALAALVRDRAVDCAVTGHDGYGRPLGDCVASGVRLSEALVRDGWAHARAAALRPGEDAARAADRGMWRTLNRS
jgi:endonuclease YncB( thermonuclease family)